MAGYAPDNAFTVTLPLSSSVSIRLVTAGLAVLLRCTCSQHTSLARAHLLPSGFGNCWVTHDAATPSPIWFTSGRIIARVPYHAGVH